MKPLVPASDAQSGVGAGGCGGKGDLQRHVGVDPSPWRPKIVDCHGLELYLHAVILCAA